MAEYILVPTAQRHLGEIRDYLAEAPPAIRNRVIDQIIQTCQQAADFPFSGLSEQELIRRDGKLTRSLLRYPYRIFYHPETSPLEIFAVIHGKRDTLRVLKGL
jgi:plasmid stabilization system protein ParE